MAYPIAAAQKLPQRHSKPLPWLFQRALHGIHSPKSLVIRRHREPCYIVGLAEIRVMALLADGRDADLRNCYTDEQGVHSLLDLAMQFGLAEITAALAEHDVDFRGHQSISEDSHFEEHAGRSLRVVVQVAKRRPELLRKVTVRLVSPFRSFLSTLRPSESECKEYSYLDLALKLGAFEDAQFLANCGVQSCGYNARDLAHWADLRYVEPKIAQREASPSESRCCSYSKLPRTIRMRCRHMTLQLPIVTRPRHVVRWTDGGPSYEKVPCDHGMLTNCRFCCPPISLDDSYRLQPAHDDGCSATAHFPSSLFLDMLKCHLDVARRSSEIAEFLRLCRFSVSANCRRENEELSLLDIAIRLGALEVVKDLMHLQVPVTTDVLTYRAQEPCKEQCCKKKFVGHKQLRNVLVSAELAGFMVEDLIKAAIQYGDIETVAHFSAKGLPRSMVGELIELAINCGNARAASHFTASGQKILDRHAPDALIQYPVQVKRTVIEAAVVAGADLRKLHSRKSEVFLCKAPPAGIPYEPRVVYREPSGRECGTEPLLAKAIRHGKQDLALELSANCCDSNLTVEALMRMVVFGQFGPCDVVSAALAAYSRCQHRHHLAIVQLTRWWKRSLLGHVSILNVPLVEKIVALASAVPRMSIPESVMPVLTLLCQFLPHPTLVQSARLCRAGLAYIVSSHIELGRVSAKWQSRYPSPCFFDAATVKPASAQPFRSDVAIEGVQAPTARVEKIASAQEAEDLSEALRISTDEAVSAYNADLLKIIARSKIERGGLSDDNIVLLRLSCRTVEVEQKLLHSDELLDIRDRVFQAGCELIPEWASGAVVLVPLTQAMIIEADFDELRAHHIIALEGDVDRITRALSEIPKRRRPKVKGIGGCTSVNPPREAAIVQCTQSDPITDRVFQNCTGATSSEQVDLVLERTFLSYREPKVVSECSHITQSAPSCVPVAEDVEKAKNPRRWCKHA